MTKLATLDLSKTKIQTSADISGFSCIIVHQSGVNMTWTAWIEPDLTVSDRVAHNIVHIKVVLILHGLHARLR